MPRDGVITVRLVVFCQVIHFLTFPALPLFLPLIREDLGITFTQAGILSAASMVSYALCQIPAGYLADRWGPRRLYFSGFLGWSALCISFGLIESFPLAVANQFVAGGFRALLFAPGLSLLASWFPKDRRATAMSLFMLGASAGAIVLSLAGPLAAQVWGWRTTLILFAVLGVVSAIGFGLFARDRPSEGTPRPATLADLRAMLRFPILWVCNALQFVRYAVVMGFNVWLPSFLVADRGFSVASAGLVMALSAALSAPSNTLGAYVSDRLRNPPLVIGGALAMLTGSALLLPFAESLTPLLVVVAVYSVFQGFYFGPLFLVPMEVLGSRVAGTATGFSNLFANAGAFCAVYLLGVVKDLSGSFAWGFIGIGIACLAGVALAGVLGRMRVHALARASD